MLGEGTYAQVFRGTRFSNGETHALKVIQTTYFSDLKEHLLKGETDVMREVNHPNIVRCEEFFESKDEVVLALQLLEGQELFDAILAEEAGFNEKKAAEVMRDILNGLSYLHSIGAVHRDIKPENIMFRNKDNTSATITDLGFAKLFDPGTMQGDLMTTTCGSCSFMAPEVVKCAAKIGTAYGCECDMWSLGCVLYCMLVGYPPFYQDPPELYTKIVMGEFEFEEEDWVGVSDEAKDLVSKMLVVDPRDRITPGDALKHPWLQTTSTSYAANMEKFKKLMEQRKYKKTKFTGGANATVCMLPSRILLPDTQSADFAPTAPSFEAAMKMASAKTSVM